MNARSKNTKRAIVVEREEDECRSLYSDIILDVVDIVDEVDDVEYLMKNISSKQLDIQLWYVLCGYVGHAVIRERKDGESMDVLFEFCHERFLDVLCYIEKHDQLRQRLLRYFSDQNFPVSFSEYVAIRLQGEIRDKFLRDHKSFEAFDGEKLKKLHFGYIVWSNFLEARSNVMSSMNVYWTERNLRRAVTSGQSENKSGLLTTIRRNLYSSKLEGEVKKTLKNKKAYAKKVNKDDFQNLQNPEVKEKFVAEALQKKKIFPSDFFPKYWLCFLLFGKPGYMESYPCFCDATSLNRRSNVLVSDLTEETHVKKKNRNDDVIGGNIPERSTVLTELPSDSLSTISNVSSVVAHLASRHHLSLIRSAIESLSRLKKLDKSNDYDDELRVQLKKMHVFCNEEIKKYEVHYMAP